MKQLIFLCIILWSSTMYSQDKVWLSGNWVPGSSSIWGLSKIVFDGASYTSTRIEPNNSFITGLTNMAISDKYNNILFYTNGLSIFNKSHDTMLNSQGFNQYENLNIAFHQSDGDNSFNLPGAVVCLQDLADSNIYHIFHGNFENLYVPQTASLDFVTYHIDETIIDITGDNGKGAVISKNVPILSGQFAPNYLTACRHGNGKDWWLLIPEYKNNVYRRLLFSEMGIAYTGSQPTGSMREGNEGGVAHFSPNGTQYAIANYNDNYYPSIRLFNFDRCRGILNPIQEWVIEMKSGSDRLLGVSFSPNSRFLYAVTFLQIWQYDTWASDIEASKIKVAEYDNYMCGFFPNSYGVFSLSQLTPNGEIWVASWSGCDVYHKIKYPDSLGIACQVEQHSIINPTITQNSIPIYPNYHLGALPNPCPTVGNTAPFGSAQGTGIKVYPNPANNRVHVYLDKAVKLPATFSIFDPYGGEVHQQPLLQPDTEIPLGGLVKGMYIYEVITDNYKSYGKLWVE